MSDFREASYIAGQSQAYLAIAEEAMRNVMVADFGERDLRAEALRAIDALRHRVRNRFDEEQP